MYKIVFTLAIAMLMAGTMLTGCQTSAEKVDDALGKLNEAQVDLNKAKQDSINEFQTFKKEAEEKILAHENSIAEFKTRIANERKENRAAYEKKLAELEQKNSDMKKKIDEYKEAGKEKWETFKAEFSRDMEELGKAFTDLTVKNVK